MTAESKVFSWWFWPRHEFQGVSDEFVVVAEGFRIRLMGSSLELSFETSGTCSPTSARALADTYLGILARHLTTPLTLITEQEFVMRTEPPLGHVNNAFSRGYRSRSESARAAKTAANQKRHTPKKVQMQPKTSVEPVELTRQVIHRYGRYLLELHGCAQASTQTFAGK